VFSLSCPVIHHLSYNSPFHLLYVFILYIFSLSLVSFVFILLSHLFFGLFNLHIFSPIFVNLHFSSVFFIFASPFYISSFYITLVSFFSLSLSVSLYSFRSLSFQSFLPYHLSCPFFPCYSQSCYLIKDAKSSLIFITIQCFSGITASVFSLTFSFFTQSLILSLFGV
jgi:hypothetical protein